MNFSNTPAFTARDASNLHNTSKWDAADWIYGKIIDRIKEEAVRSQYTSIDLAKFFVEYEEPCDKAAVHSLIVSHWKRQDLL